MRAVFAGRALFDINEGDVQRLIENRVPESDILDYKLRPDLDSDKGKKEFVRDVVSFANTNGGLIVYGVDENRVDGQSSGIPGACVGFEVATEDSLLRQCRSILDDGVDERISGIEMRALPLVSGKTVLLLRVPRSLQAPHQVTRDKDFRFYGRHGAQRSPLTRSQVKDIVLRNARRYDEIREQHLRRYAQYQQGRPVGFWMLHAVPLVPQPEAFDLADHETVQRLEQKLAPPMAMMFPGYGFAHCLDGFKAQAVSNVPSLLPNIALLLRDGSLEFVEHYALQYGERYVLGRAIENGLFESFDRAKAFYDEGDLTMPFVVSLSVFGLSNRVIGAGGEARTFTVNEITFEPLVVTDPGMEAPTLMKAWMDVLWQSAGWMRALTFGEDGTWSRPGGNAR